MTIRRIEGVIQRMAPGVKFAITEHHDLRAEVRVHMRQLLTETMAKRLRVKLESDLGAGIRLRLTWDGGQPEMKPRSVLQDWVMELGLRHQGVLLSAVRGCDTAPKNDPSKLLARCYRAAVLESHSMQAEGKAPASFMEFLDLEAVAERMTAFVRGWDQYPMHYVMHLIHAAEVVGYYHPDMQTRSLWNAFYTTCCHKLHLACESEAALGARLNANEDDFENQQRELVDLTQVARALPHAIETVKKAQRCKSCGNAPCNCRFAGT